MNDIVFETTKVIAKQILMEFISFNKAIFPILDKDNFYQVPFYGYAQLRAGNSEKFSKELYRLKQQKFIKKYIKDKEAYFELTKKGKKLLKKYLTNQLKLTLPTKWDKKWRIVIFDIPNQKNECRDAIRHKLERMGFVELQKSVYVFPFDCWAEIHFLKKLYFIEPYVQYIVAHRIETDIDLIKIFLDNKVLDEKMIG